MSRVDEELEGKDKQCDFARWQVSHTNESATETSLETMFLSFEIDASLNLLCNICKDIPDFETAVLQVEVFTFKSTETTLDFEDEIVQFVVDILETLTWHEELDFIT